MDASCDLAHWGVRAAALLHWTACAVLLAGAVVDRAGFGDMRARVLERAPLAAQRVALRAMVFVGLRIPLEFVDGEGAIVAWIPLPHRHVGLDVPVMDHPGQHRGGAICGITRSGDRGQGRSVLRLDRASSSPTRPPPCDGQVWLARPRSRHARYRPGSWSNTHRTPVHRGLPSSGTADR